MRRPLAIAAITLLATLVAVPAFAGEGKAQAKFPVPAAEFKQKIDARLAKARARMEERVSKLPADQAKNARAQFDARVAKVDAEVKKAIADGTVTKEEAGQVRAAMKEMRGGHGHGKHARANVKK